MIGTRHALCVALLLLSSMGSLSAQTLEQSVSFILSGGRLDLSDIKQIAPDTVNTRDDYSKSNMLKVMDRQQCILRAFSDRRLYYVEYNFNNIILDETKSGNATFHGEVVPSMELRGEKDVACGVLTGCAKSFAIMLDPSNVERVTNALKYVYSKFCASAKRESAF